MKDFFGDGSAMMVLMALSLGTFGCSAPTNAAQNAQGAATQPTAPNGVINGGGGKGVLCGNGLRTLDLFESESIQQLPPLRERLDVEALLRKYGSRLAMYFEHRKPSETDVVYEDAVVRNIHADLDSRWVDLPPGQTLALTEDATVPTLPSGCSVVQIAVQTRDGKIFRDRILWERLSPEDQAALMLHEGLYFQARRSGATTSDETRRLIGMIFAGQILEPQTRPIWGSPKILECLAGQLNQASPGGMIQKTVYEFRAGDETREGRTGLGIYFDSLHGSFQMGRTSLFVPGVSVDDFLDSGYAPLRGTASDELFGTTWSVELSPRDPEISSGEPGRISLRAWRSGESAPEFSIGSCLVQSHG